MNILVQKGKRKVQGVPQSQTAALPRPQEEEESQHLMTVQDQQLGHAFSFVTCHMN